MRIILSVFFILIFCILFSQKSFSLQLKTDDKTSVHGTSYWQDVKITGADTTMSLNSDELPEKKITGLKKGTYTLIFTSLFGQKITKKVTVNSDTFVKVKLEKLNKKISPAVLSSKIKKGDTLYIIHNATGKIPGDKIAVTNAGGKYIAMQYKGLGSEILTKREISIEELAHLGEIEKATAKNNKTSGCSVIESYTFYKKKKYYTVNDGTCEWAGFSKLMKVLFPE